MGRGSIRGARSAGARETGEKYTPECNFRGGGEEKKRERRGMGMLYIYARRRVYFGLLFLLLSAF